MDIKVNKTTIITCTIDEMREIVARYLGIDGDIVWNHSPQQEPDDSWFDVPVGWDQPRCPHVFIMVDVKYRNGNINPYQLSERLSYDWKDNSSPYDIVQYREAF